MHTGSVDGLPLRAGLRPSEAALDMAARHQTCKDKGGGGEDLESERVTGRINFLFYTVCKIQRCCLHRTLCASSVRVCGSQAPC